MATTPATYPPHLACLLCDPGVEFYSFWDQTRHYYAVHPLVMQPDLCKCGHQRGAHVPNKRAYCQAASDGQICRCAQYEPQRGQA
jgi:hypothetical protein